uniref:SWIM-type domain-containing protein n=1 Tax=Setaria italica TaxID=4555 RepID=K4A226_SETIT
MRVQRGNFYQSLPRGGVGIGWEFVLTALLAPGRPFRAQKSDALSTVGLKTCQPNCNIDKQGDGALVPVASISTLSSEYVSVQVGANKEVYHEDEDVVCSQLIMPKVGMEFDTIQEARRVYNEYAMKLGFNIRVASSRNSNVTKELIRKEWECSHARKPALDGEDNGEENTLVSRSTNDTATLIMGVLADFHGGLGNLTFSSKDVSNMRTHLRGGVTYRDMDATLEYFQKQQAESSSLYYATMIDDNNVVRGLFWVDGRTRELYKRFGDCIFFDTTYCTNRYDMPFVPIVGINNHLHSILLGCAMLSDETTETFVWVLERLKGAMGGYFAWLISEEEDFAKEFDYCVNRTKTPEEFEMLWASIEDKYHLQENEFFQSMFGTRRMWASAYFRKYFFPFTGTIGRSESINSLFKKVVHSQDSMLQFITQYDYIMDTRAERENKECCKGEILDAPLWGRYAFEKQAAAFYTGEVFDATSYTCSCNMFDRDGLLCPHILKVFTNRDVKKISEKYLLRRWSKEVTIMIPERLSGTESAFGVPTTNKLRYNTLCRKMTSLAVEACLGHEQYIVASAGIDTLVQAVRTARGSQEMQQNEASNVATSQQSKTPAVMVKNPTRTKGKGRPKEKVERFKSIVAQAKEKAMKKKAKGKKTAQKIPPCSYCFEDDHSVQTCAYMAKTEALAKDLKETELKL